MGSIKKVEKRGNVGEPSKDRSERDDNKRTRTGNVFATTINPVGRENTCTWPKCTPATLYYVPVDLVAPAFKYNRPGPFCKGLFYRGVTRNGMRHGSFDVIIGIPDDLSGLPPIREIEFRIELIPEGNCTVGKVSLSIALLNWGVAGQIKELQDKGFIRPSSSPWGSTVLFVRRRMVHLDRSRPYLDKFVIVFIDNILIYSNTREEHVEYLRHVINGNGIHVDPSKIKAVKNWKAPRTLMRTRLFVMREVVAGVIAFAWCDRDWVAKDCLSLCFWDKLCAYECYVEYSVDCMFCLDRMADVYAYPVWCGPALILVLPAVAFRCGLSQTYEASPTIIIDVLEYHFQGEVKEDSLVCVIADLDAVVLLWVNVEQTRCKTTMFMDEDEYKGVSYLACDGVYSFLFENSK
ncbi:hypothetical protein Tco_0451773 [Tanacetum coccineum]